MRSQEEIKKALEALQKAATRCQSEEAIGVFSVGISVLEWVSGSNTGTGNAFEEILGQLQRLEDRIAAGKKAACN